MGAGTGSGLYIDPSETSPRKMSDAIKQLAEGRSNAVGTFTLTGDGATTQTVVEAATCGLNSVVVLMPLTANAAAAITTTYIGVNDVGRATFTVTHAATSNSDETFAYACIG